jgi:hypothetical protein
VGLAEAAAGALTKTARSDANGTQSGGLVAQCVVMDATARDDPKRAEAVLLVTHAADATSAASVTDCLNADQWEAMVAATCPANCPDLRGADPGAAPPLPMRLLSAEVQAQMKEFNCMTNEKDQMKMKLTNLNSI